MLSLLRKKKTQILWFIICVYLLNVLLDDQEDVSSELGRGPGNVPRVPEHHSVFSHDELNNEETAPVNMGASVKEQPPTETLPQSPENVEAINRQKLPVKKHHQSVPLGNAHRETQNIVAPPVKSHAQKPKLKRILFWTKYFRSKQFQFGFGQWPFLHHKCPVNTCITTDDRTTLSEADVVMFHGPLIKELPKVRPANQLYVFVQKEPWLDKSAKTIHAYDNIMNLTMSYRIDSDIFFPYGITFINETLRGRKVDIDPQSRPKSIAWPVSHCETDSRRELYAKELQKYIDIDIYGDCGHLECSKQRNTECWQMFERNYRFVLAFENDACVDYVTEKAYRPLSHDIVPIVYGGANYKKLTPPRSVINIMDYPNPNDLAKYLKYLSKNKEAYNDYLQWKIDGSQVETYKETLMVDAFCQLCALLHNKNYKFTKYSDMKKWWVDGACDRHAMDKLRTFW